MIFFLYPISLALWLIDKTAYIWVWFLTVLSSGNAIPSASPAGITQYTSILPAFLFDWLRSVNALVCQQENLFRWNPSLVIRKNQKVPTNSLEYFDCKATQRKCHWCIVVIPQRHLYGRVSRFWYLTSNYDMHVC